MAHSFIRDGKTLQVGDLVTVEYKIKESDGKERIQPFEGVLTAIKGGSQDTKMITVRKVSKSGVGVERIFPLISPHIASIMLVKQSNYNKAKLYFLPQLSSQKLRQKLFKSKGATPKKA